MKKSKNPTKGKKKERIVDITTHRAAPAVLRAHLRPPVEQQANDVGEALTSGDVQSGATVDVPEVDVNAGGQDLLDPLQVALAGEVHEADVGVHVIGEPETIAVTTLVAAAAIGGEGGLLAEGESSGGLGLHRP